MVLRVVAQGIAAVVGDIMSDISIVPNGTLPNVHSRGVVTQRFAGRLKICIISETLHAGVGRHIMDAVSALSERGHEVHLLYSPIRIDPDFLAVLSKRPNVVCRAVPMERAIGWKDITAFKTVAAYVRNNGPFDIVHGHSAKGGGYARLLKLISRQTVLYSPHAFITSSPLLGSRKRAIYRIIETALAKLTDRLICCSSVEQEHAVQFGFARDQLSVIANGGAPFEAPNREDVRAELGLLPKQVVVGFIGRMEDQKAPERLIAVARQLLPELPKLVFLMIGDGPKRAALELDLQRAGMADRVLWLGAVDARRYLPAMDIFALCSLYEGFAYVMLEALFAGLPIVSTPVGGAREGIADGVNGILVPQGDLSVMASSICSLANDTTLRLSMAAESRRRAEQFTIPRMVDALERLYFEVSELAVAPRPAHVIAGSDVPAST